MKSIKSVEFVFENVECFSIDAKYFGVMDIGDFERRIERVASNCIADHTIAHKILFEIFAEADGKYDSYGEDHMKFKRILDCDDITHIEITYDDDTTDSILVDYDEGMDAGALGANNINQTSMLSDLGNLYICIWPGHRVKAEFPPREINDVDLIEEKKDFYFRIDDEIAAMSEEERKEKMIELEQKLSEDLPKLAKVVANDV